MNGITDVDMIMRWVSIGKRIQVWDPRHEAWMLASDQDRISIRHWIRMGGMFRSAPPLSKGSSRSVMRVGDIIPNVDGYEQLVEPVAVVVETSSSDVAISTDGARRILLDAKYRPVGEPLSGRWWSVLAKDSDLTCSWHSNGSGRRWVDVAVFSQGDGLSARVPTMPLKAPPRVMTIDVYAPGRGGFIAMSPDIGSGG